MFSGLFKFFNFLGFIVKSVFFWKDIIIGSIVSLVMEWIIFSLVIRLGKELLLLLIPIRNFTIVYFLYFSVWLEAVWIQAAHRCLGLKRSWEFQNWIGAQYFSVLFLAFIVKGKHDIRYSGRYLLDDSFGAFEGVIGLLGILDFYGDFLRW